jgi:hypothetical protein
VIVENLTVLREATPAFRHLASRAGWTVDRVLDGTAHHVVRPRKA